MDFCECGSIKRNGKCSNVRCPESTLKRKDWIIGGAQMHFKKAITYDQAFKLATKDKS